MTLTEALGVGPLALLAAAVAVTVGAFLQRLAGQGFGSTVSPLVALIAAERLPAAVLLLGAVTAGLSARGDSRAIDWKACGPALAGRAIGALAAAFIIAAAPGPDRVALAVALTVLLGVGLSLSRWRVAITTLSLTGAGFLSGLMGTLTAVGAPPMGLLYQHEAARRARATLNAFFLIGLGFSLAALVWEGLIGRKDVLFALALVPAIFLGVALAGPAARRMDGAALRPFAIGLATIAALSLLIKALW